MDEEKGTKKEKDFTQKNTDNDTSNSIGQKLDTAKESLRETIRHKDAIISLNFLVKIFFYVIATSCLILAATFAFFILKEFGNLMLVEGIVHLVAGALSGLVGLILLKIGRKINEDTNETYIVAIFLAILIFVSIIVLIIDIVIRL